MTKLITSLIAVSLYLGIMIPLKMIQWSIVLMPYIFMGIIKLFSWTIQLMVWLLPLAFGLVLLPIKAFSRK